MADCFKPESGTDAWSANYYEKVLHSIREESQDKLDILTKAIEENWTLSQLMETFPDDFIVYLSGNCSGVNVANLSNHIVSEWTW